MHFDKLNVTNLFAFATTLNKKPSAHTEGCEEYVHLIIEIRFVLLFHHKD